MRKLVALLVLIVCLVAAASFALGDAASPSFTFSTDEPGATFTCQLDNGTAAPCSSPRSESGLAPGQHTETIVSTFNVPQPPPKPVASFTITPNPAIQGQSTAFDSGASTCYAPCSYSWTDPSDGSTYATTANFSYTFHSLGAHQVKLAITDGLGLTDSSTQTFNVQAPAPPPPPPGPCNNTTALTDYLHGPHLCGYPDATNTGYQNAPGYPGSLEVASASSATCPTVPQSNHTYSFCKYAGLNIPAGLTNVTFYGDDFAKTSPGNANISGGSGATGLTFNYITVQPAITYPGDPTHTTQCPANLGSTSWQSCGSRVTCPQSYQYGIYNEGGAMKGYTVENSYFWGFGNAIDTAGSTQAAPQNFHDNFFSDAVTAGGCGYHTDGIGLLCGNCGAGGSLNSGAGCCEAYATVDHNSFAFTGNTNEIAWQAGKYDHIANTNNFMDGDNAMYAGARTTCSGCSAQFITTTGNLFDAYLPHATGNYPIDLAGGYATSTGSTWSGNYWAVPPGSSAINAAGTSATAPGKFNGYFVVPTTNSSGFPNDCGWVSQTDWPNVTNPC